VRKTRAVLQHAPRCKNALASTVGQAVVTNIPNVYRETPDVMIGEMVESRGEGSDRRSAVALVGAAGRSAWRPGFQAAPTVAVYSYVSNARTA
jgi:hypothetical protein